MKILFFFSSAITPTSGGVENVTSFWYNYYTQKGHEVHIIYWKENPIIEKVIPQVQLPDTSCCYSQQNIDFLHNYIIQYGIDIIYNQSGLNNRTSAVCTESRKGTDAKLISIIHNTPYSALKSKSFLNKIGSNTIFSKLLKKLYTFLMRNYSKYNGKYQYENSDATVVLAPAYIEEYKEIYGINDSNKLFSIPNPITINDIDNQNAKENIVLFVGRLSKVKAVDRLLEAWKIIMSNKSLQNWKLYILGDGPMKEHLMVKCDQESIDNVIFTGNTDPKPYYRKAKIFCMTSKYEGLPMTLIECQYYGVVPIIMNSYAAASNIVNTGYNGIVVKENITDFANATIKLMKDAISLSEMSINCRNEMDNYSPKNIYNMQMQLINSINHK